MNKYILYTGTALSAIVLSACTSPADKALEQAKKSKAPADCINAFITILRDVEKSKDQEKAKAQLTELGAVIRDFSTVDALKFISELRKEETQKQLQELKTMLQEEKIQLPSIMELGKSN